MFEEGWPERAFFTGFARLRDQPARAAVGGREGRGRGARIANHPKTGSPLDAPSPPHGSIVLDCWRPNATSKYNDVRHRSGQDQPTGRIASRSGGVLVRHSCLVSFRDGCAVSGILILICCDACWLSSWLNCSQFEHACFKYGFGRVVSWI